MHSSRGKRILIEIHPLDRELRSLLYHRYPKNALSICSTIDPDEQSSIAIRDRFSSLLAMYNTLVIHEAAQIGESLKFS